MLQAILKVLENLPSRINDDKAYTFDELEVLRDEPGIYLILYKDEIIYIGYSDNLLNRVTNFTKELNIKNEVSTYHTGPFSLKRNRKLPNKIEKYKFKFLQESDSYKNLLFERFLIYLYQPIVNKK